MLQGFKRPIQHADLPTLPDTVKTENCYPEFRNRRNSFLQRSKTTENVWTTQLGLDQLAVIAAWAQADNDSIDCNIPCVHLQGRAILKKTEDGQTAGPLFKTLYGIHAIPLAWALFLQILYNGQQFAGPLLLKKITTFLDQTVYGLAVSPLLTQSSSGPWFGCYSELHHASILQQQHFCMFAGRQCENQLPVGSPDVRFPDDWRCGICAQLTPVHHCTDQDAGWADCGCLSKGFGPQFQVSLCLHDKHYACNCKSWILT